MNKIFKTIGMAATAAMLVGFTACGSDDEPVNPVNPTPGQETENGAAENVTPAVALPQGAPTQVGEYSIKTNSKGQVTEIKNADGDVTVFNYNSNAVLATNRAVSIPSDYDMTMVTTEEDGDQTIFYITLNSNGFAQYVYEVEKRVGEEDEAQEYWFEYDANGRMSKMKRTEGSETTTISYNADGDMIGNEMTSADGDVTTVNIKYTDATHENPIENKSGIMLFDEVFRVDLDEFEVAYFAGLLGKATAHLPLEVAETQVEQLGSGSVYNSFTSYSLEWTLNSSLMPTALKITVHEQYSESVRNYTFAW